MSKFLAEGHGLEVLENQKKDWLSSTEQAKLVHIQNISIIPMNLYGYWKKPHFLFCEDSGTETTYYSVVIPEEQQK